MTYKGFEETRTVIKSASFLKKGCACISKLLNVCIKTALLCRKEVWLITLPAVLTCQALKMFGAGEQKALKGCLEGLTSSYIDSLSSSNKGGWCHL